MEKIFLASGASRSAVYPSLIRDQTVVVNWTWSTREAHIKLACRDTEQSRPRQLHFEESIDNCIGPECRKAGLQELTAHDKDHKHRNLRIIVEREMQPLTKSRNPDKLAAAFRGIVECHHWLYETAQILHRDISLSNLMFQRIGDDVYGILKDFDIAATEWPFSSKHRTGTRVYTAADLLVDDPPKHLYRHDLESFLYVFVFLTCEIDGSDLGSWHTLGMKALRDNKFAVFKEKEFPPQKSECGKFLLWVILLRALFLDGFSNRDKHVSARRVAQLGAGPMPASFNDLTLGGAVTFEAFAGVLVPEHLRPI
ncbi:hypothetical protein C8R47DRAFT_994570 [Mycena vitilis]|nr:hypothetical protein C8R47DRAFT_994570 [Mycena vitilis]